MGRILVAYDGSEAAKKAIEHGINLLKPDDKIVVIHVIPSAAIAEFAQIDPEISLARAQESMDRLLAELEERHINSVGIVKEGDIADEILKLGEELKCELIVVGHKGKQMGKISRFQLGSVADKVARYAQKPVLIVR